MHQSPRSSSEPAVYRIQRPAESREFPAHLSRALQRSSRLDEHAMMSGGHILTAITGLARRPLKAGLSWSSPPPPWWRSPYAYALGYQDHTKARLAAHHMLIGIGCFRQGKGLDHGAHVRLHAEFQRLFGVRRSA